MVPRAKKIVSRRVFAGRNPHTGKLYFKTIDEPAPELAKKGEQENDSPLSRETPTAQVRRRGPIRWIDQVVRGEEKREDIRGKNGIENE